MLPPADAYVVSEKKQKQNHSHLNDAHTPLRGNDGLHPGCDQSRIGGNRNDPGHQQHDQARPFEEHRTQIPQGMEQAENIHENFMNNGKTESHAEPVANPVEAEGSGRTPPNGGKYHGKGNQLGENVAEEELEFAVQSAPEHKRSDGYLKHGMCDPERVIENSNFLAHLFSLIAKAT